VVRESSLWELWCENKATCCWLKFLRPWITCVGAHARGWPGNGSGAFMVAERRVPRGAMQNMRAAPSPMVWPNSGPVCVYQTEGLWRVPAWSPETQGLWPDGAANMLGLLVKRHAPCMQCEGVPCKTCAPRLPPWCGQTQGLYVYIKLRACGAFPRGRLKLRACGPTVLQTCWGCW
jgi:hypothetical protein